MHNGSVVIFGSAPDVGLILLQHGFNIVEASGSDQCFYLWTHLIYKMVDCLLHVQSATYGVPNKFECISLAC